MVTSIGEVYSLLSERRRHIEGDNKGRETLNLDNESALVVATLLWVEELLDQVGEKCETCERYYLKEDAHLCSC